MCWGYSETQQQFTFPLAYNMTPFVFADMMMRKDAAMTGGYDRCAMNITQTGFKSLYAATSAAPVGYLSIGW
jgi:hypothetical protein